ncbi:MAG: PAS domain-containing protein [Planctomycetota bacterium]|nr:PAS domain-containing protein [Planctomycetota bacterium]
MEAATQAQELAHATERLRVEIGERKRIEESLQDANTALLQVVSQREAMLENLQLHQTELQMQNEELCTAQLALDTVRARYFDLYDLAPVGYCIVSEQGLIQDVNLTAADLLGVVKGDMVKQPLSRFILPEDQDIHYLNRKQLLKTGTPQAYELRLVKQDGTAFWTRLEATVTQEEGGQLVSRIVLSDITERRRVEAELRESVASQREQAVLLESEKKYSTESKQTEQKLREANCQLAAAVTLARSWPCRPRRPTKPRAASWPP